MKCVVIALALLCSAQALKMDLKPSAKIQETMNKLDRYHGRPMRKLKDLTKKSQKKGSVDDYETGLGESSHAFAEAYDVDYMIQQCKINNIMAEDIVQCAGEELADQAGLDDEVCALIDAYWTDAEAIAEELAEDQVVESDSEDKMESYMYKIAPKKKAFDVQLALVVIAIVWWGSAGTIIDMQDMIDFWYYCDTIVGYSMAHQLTNTETYLDFDESAEDENAAAEAMAKDNAALRFPGPQYGGGKSDGSAGAYFKGQEEAATKLNVVERHEREHHRLTARKQMRENWKLAQKGRFRRAHRRYAKV